MAKKEETKSTQDTPLYPVDYEKATGDPKLATLLATGTDDLGGGNTLVPDHKLKDFFNPEEEENPESGSIDSDDESGSKPVADTPDDSGKDAKPEEEEESEEEESDDEESEDEESEDEEESEEEDTEEEELDVDALLGVIPEDLRDEKDVEKSFENWVKDYYDLKQAKAETPSEPSEDLEDATKKQNQLAQELAEAKKLIARQNQLLGGSQDVQPKVLQPGQQAPIPKPTPAKKEAVDSGADLAKIGDFSGQEFKHDFFDEPDLALAERLQLFGKQIVDNVGQMQSAQVQNYITQMQAEQRLLDEWNQFTKSNPDFESVKTEMLEVFQANPDLNRTPGALETVYTEAKRLQKARFGAIAKRLEEMGFQRPSSAQKATPERDDKGRFKPAKDTPSKSTMPEEELEKAKRFLSRRATRGPATENMKQSSGKPSAAPVKSRSRKSAPAISEEDALWQNVINAEQGIHDIVNTGDGGTIGVSLKPERDKGADKLREALKGI